MRIEQGELKADPTEMNDRIKGLLAVFGQVIGWLVIAVGALSLVFGLLNYDAMAHGTPIGLVLAFFGLVFVAMGYGLVRVIQLLRGTGPEGAVPKPDRMPRV